MVPGRQPGKDHNVFELNVPECKRLLIQCPEGPLKGVLQKQISLTLFI